VAVLADLHRREAEVGNCSSREVPLRQVIGLPGLNRREERRLLLRDVVADDLADLLRLRVVKADAGVDGDEPADAACGLNFCMGRTTDCTTWGLPPTLLVASGVTGMVSSGAV